MKMFIGGFMAIQPVSFSNYSKYQTNFKASENYENPISRKSERNLAILGSVGGSVLVGTLAGLGSSLFPKIKEKGWKWQLPIGAAVGLIMMGLTLPSKLYNTKVNAYAREKEMDVFSRQKSAQSNIYEDIDNEIKDDKVSLDDKINHYATVKMADNGNGMMIKGV